jgi:hypothetical protein
VRRNRSVEDADERVQQKCGGEDEDQALAETDEQAVCGYATLPPTSRSLTTIQLMPNSA